MITRKLHFTYLPKSSQVKVQVCQLDEIKRARKLVSSSDGVVAFDVHRPADAVAKRGWAVIGEHRFSCVLVMPWNADEVATIAMQIWKSLGEPDVGAMVFSADVVFTRIQRASVPAQWMAGGLGEHEAYVLDAPIGN